MTRRHTPAAGSRNGNAVLDEEAVHTIREAEGQQSAREVADWWGVHVETVRRIWRREAWNWLPARQRAQPVQSEAAASAARLKELLEKGDDDGAGHSGG